MAGTRVSLDSIVQAFQEGLSAESICSEFDTSTLAQVYGAIAHYLENEPLIDAYRIRQEQRFAAARRLAEPLPIELRQRMQAAREQLRSGRAE